MDKTIDTPLFTSIDLPEVRVRPALFGVHWALAEEVNLPEGTVVKARLKRSGLAVGRIVHEAGMRTFRPSEQWDLVGARR